MSGVFGYGSNYPPGAAGDPNAPWNQVEGPCDVCGKNVDDCICPECPVCGEIGRVNCYEDFSETNHGLKMNQEQKVSLDDFNRQEEENRRRLIEMEKQYYESEPKEDLV